MKTKTNNTNTANAPKKGARTSNAQRTFADIARDASRDVRKGTRGLLFCNNTLNRAAKRNEEIDSTNVKLVGQEVQKYHEDKKPFHLSACYTHRGRAYVPVRIKDESACESFVRRIGSREFLFAVLRKDNDIRIQRVIRDSAGRAYRLAPAAQSPVGLLRAYIAYVKMQQLAAKEEKPKSKQKQISELIRMRKDGLITDAILGVRVQEVLAA